MANKIVEWCQVAPSSGAPAEQLLKLLHMDMACLVFPLLVKPLFFYKFNCSESHFMVTIVPNLKHSLSLTLKHFPPLAGKIFIDNNSGLPVSHYVDGQDSLSLTIAVSYADFVSLTGYHPRDAAQLNGFAPDVNGVFSLASKHSALAIQLTLFPNKGVCIGIDGNHALGDGVALVLFMKMWASINKANGDDDYQLGKECLPFYDRDVVRNGYRLAVECWRDISSTLLSPSAHIPFNDDAPPHKHMLEATFVLSEAEIQKLKNLAIAANSKKREIISVSSFVVACAHLWACLAKSAATAGEEVDDDEPDYLNFPINCRGRLNPPLPDNYFGNCSAIVTTELTYGELRGEEGFIAAADAISGTIRKTVGNGRGCIDGSPELFLGILERMRQNEGKRMLTVGGSPGFDFYGADFGWGRPIKFEALHGNHNFLFVIFSNSRYRGGIEICVSMPKVKMDAFAASFNQGLVQAIEKSGSKM